MLRTAGPLQRPGRPSGYQIASGVGTIWAPPE